MFRGLYGMHAVELIIGVEMIKVSDTITVPNDPMSPYGMEVCYGSQY